MTRRIWPAVLVGLGLGTFLSVTPMALLWWLGVLMVLSLGIVLRERRIALAAAVAGGVMGVATALPFELENEPIGPLPSATPTLAELVRAGVLFEPSDAGVLTNRLQLVRNNPSRRELTEAINAQTSLRARYYRCGTMATCLRGAGLGKISVTREPSIAVPSAP